MADVKKKRFNMRAFTAFVLLLCALGLPITGVANHELNQGPMTVARHAWMTAHNVLGTLFITFTVWHVVLVRRPLFAYIRGVPGRVPGLNRELWLAVAVVGIVLFLLVSHAFHGGGAGGFAGPH